MRLPLLHIPDGFINLPVSLIFIALSALGVLACLSGARAQLDDKTAPLAGLVTVFIFGADD